MRYLPNAQLGGRYLNEFWINFTYVRLGFSIVGSVFSQRIVYSYSN